MSGTSVQLVREGAFVAAVTVDTAEGGEWGPTIDMIGIAKIDRVREALRRGELGRAQKEADIYKLVLETLAVEPEMGFAEPAQAEILGTSTHHK